MNWQILISNTIHVYRTHPPWAFEHPLPTPSEQSTGKHKALHPKELPLVTKLENWEYKCSFCCQSNEEIYPFYYAFCFNNALSFCQACQFIRGNSSRTRWVDCDRRETEKPCQVKLLSISETYKVCKTSDRNHSFLQRDGEQLFEGVRCGTHKHLCTVSA